MTISTRLTSPLPATAIKKKQGKFDYIKGSYAIEVANDIFGFSNWTVEILDLAITEDSLTMRKPGPDNKYLVVPANFDQTLDQMFRWQVGYRCTVRVTVTIDGVTTFKDGIGSGQGLDPYRGVAHESASKEAETDAMKRALRYFGSAFGLDLYDMEGSVQRRNEVAEAEAHELKRLADKWKAWGGTKQMFIDLGYSTFSQLAEVLKKCPESVTSLEEFEAWKIESESPE